LGEWDDYNCSVSYTAGTHSCSGSCTFDLKKYLDFHPQHRGAKWRKNWSILYEIMIMIIQDNKKIYDDIINWICE